MKPIKTVYVITTYPRFEPPEIFRNAEQLVFETWEKAQEYAIACEKEEYFWGYSIQKRYFVGKNEKVI